MGQDVFVDVAYRGLELGRRLKLREVGPHTAYLEHATPMPVGAGLVIRTDDGLSIPVVVIRVHEQVAGAEMPPGVRVRAEQLEGAAAGWWRGLVTCEDPVIPESVLPVQASLQPAITPVSPEAQLPEAQDTVVMVAVDFGPEAGASSTTDGPAGGNGAGAGAGQGDGAAAQTSGRTVEMSALEIKRITDTASGGGDGENKRDPHGEPTAGAPLDAAEDDSGAEIPPGSNGDELQSGRGRGRRRRRRR